MISTQDYVCSTCAERFTSALAVQRHLQARQHQGYHVETLPFCPLPSSGSQLLVAGSDKLLQNEHMLQKPSLRAGERTGTHHALTTIHVTGQAGLTHAKHSSQSLAQAGSITSQPGMQIYYQPTEKHSAGSGATYNISPYQGTGTQRIQQEGGHRRQQIYSHNLANRMSLENGGLQAVAQLNNGTQLNSHKMSHGGLQAISPHNIEYKYTDRLQAASHSHLSNGLATSSGANAHAYHSGGLGTYQLSTAIPHKHVKVHCAGQNSPSSALVSEREGSSRKKAPVIILRSRKQSKLRQQSPGFAKLVSVQALQNKKVELVRAETSSKLLHNMIKHDVKQKFVFGGGIGAANGVHGATNLMNRAGGGGARGTVLLSGAGRGQSGQKLARKSRGKIIIRHHLKHNHKGVQMESEGKSISAIEEQSVKLGLIHGNDNEDSFNQILSNIDKVGIQKEKEVPAPSKKSLLPNQIVLSQQKAMLEDLPVEEPKRNYLFRAEPDPTLRPSKTPVLLAQVTKAENRPLQVRKRIQINKLDPPQDWKQEYQQDIMVGAERRALYQASPPLPKEAQSQGRTLLQARTQQQSLQKQTPEQQVRMEERKSPLESPARVVEQERVQIKLKQVKATQNAELLQQKKMQINQYEERKESVLLNQIQQKEGEPALRTHKRLFVNKEEARPIVTVPIEVPMGGFRMAPSSQPSKFQSLPAGKQTQQRTYESVQPAGQIRQSKYESAQMKRQPPQRTYETVLPVKTYETEQPVQQKSYETVQPIQQKTYETVSPGQRTFETRQAVGQRTYEAALPGGRTYETIRPTRQSIEIDSAMGMRKQGALQGGQMRLNNLQSARYGGQDNLEMQILQHAGGVCSHCSGRAEYVAYTEVQAEPGVEGITFCSNCIGKFKENHEYASCQYCLAQIGTAKDRPHRFLECEVCHDRWRHYIPHEACGRCQMLDQATQYVAYPVIQPIPVFTQVSDMQFQSLSRSHQASPHPAASCYYCEMLWAQHMQLEHDPQGCQFCLAQYEAHAFEGHASEGCPICRRMLLIHQRRRHNFGDCSMCTRLNQQMDSEIDLLYYGHDDLDSEEIVKQSRANSLEEVSGKLEEAIQEYFEDGMGREASRVELNRILMRLSQQLEQDKDVDLQTLVEDFIRQNY